MKKYYSILKPQLFPDIEYFQLISHSDVLVFDDLDSCINKDTILLYTPETSTGIVVEYNDSGESGLRCLNTIYTTYLGSPYFHDAMDLLELCFRLPSHSLTHFNMLSTCCVCGYLDIRPEVYVCSEWGVDATKKFTQIKEKLPDYLPITTTENIYINHGVECSILKSMDNVENLKNVSIIHFLFWHHPKEFNNLKKYYKVETK